MTKQIGRAYRRNRTGSWLIIAVIVATAVVAIPMASGHSTTIHVGTISGKVWQDTNEDGIPGAVALEPGQQFRVNLYAKVIGNLYVQSQFKTSDANGNYTFTNVPFGPSYLVCEQLPAGAPWSQTTPLVQTKPCGTVPINKPNGYAFTFTASLTDRNFGNVQSVPLSPEQSCGSGNFAGATVSAGFEYEARLTLPTGVCKTGSLVMLTYQDGSSRVATLHPPAGAPETTKYPVVERFKWTGVGTAQNPIDLYYDDVAPYNGADKRLMEMCTSDPRPDPVGAPFVLGANPESVLPPASPAHTSCMIVSTEKAGGTYEAYVFSKVDGWKGGG